MTGSVTATEILGGSGADIVIIDTEHSVSSLVVVLEQLRVLEAADTFTIVRAPSNTPSELGRLLDAGARGIMVPMIDSADDARAAVSAMRYPPRGRRGVGGGFARATRWTQVGDYLQRSDDAHALIVQLETTEALAAIPEILAVDGVDAAFIGPADLAASLGFLGQPRHPEVRAAVERAIAAVLATGKPVGVNAFAAEDAKHYAGLGATILGIGADATVLVSGSSALVAQFGSEGQP
ncbi:MAG: aldolase/citrate lyase family protein [Rhodoglobus sp.]|nr:aldolase/citrate lyase family protein [Rhodoglobus sp.]